MWIQRIHAELFQHGVAVPEAAITAPETKGRLTGEEVELSPAGRQRIGVGYKMIAAIENELVELRGELQRFSARQPACRALCQTHFGIGPLTSVVTWAELGDCRRFSRSMQVVRHAGLDVTVHASDLHRPGGFLSREGPATLRWALFEAGKCAARRQSPDYDYYQTVKGRHGGKVATLAVARKLALRCYHTLRAIDPEEVYAMAA